MRRKRVLKSITAIILAIALVLSVPVFSSNNVGSVRADGDDEIITVKASYDLSFVTKQEMISRINEIRQEAADLGYISTYTPIQWSSSLEEIAIVRAAETSILFSHTRPNGQSWDTVKASNGWGSGGEIIASPANALSAINLWYSEISEYKKEVNGESHGTTGHYTAMIFNKYIGIASFGCTAGEVSNRAGASENQINTAGTKTMEIQMKRSQASLLVFPADGKTYSTTTTEFMVLRGVTQKFASKIRGGWSTLNAIGTWSSDNEAVATVDANGNVTAVSDGTANITFDDGGFSKTVSVTVKAMTGYDEIEAKTIDCGMNPRRKIPSTVTMHWSTGETTSETVTWDEIPSAMYDRAGGRVNVTGHVDGYDGDIICPFDVNPAYVFYADSFDDIETIQGTPATLPTSTHVMWSNGDETNENITWDGQTEDNYGTAYQYYKVTGDVCGKSVQVWVYVNPKEENNSGGDSGSSGSLGNNSSNGNSSGGNTDSSGGSGDNSFGNGSNSSGGSGNNSSGNDSSGGNSSSGNSSDTSGGSGSSGSTGGGSSNSGSGSSSSSSSSGKPSYSNEWVNGKWYNADGSQTYRPTLSWKWNGIGWWIEDSSGWYPVSKWQKINGTWYYFNASGYMASGEWVDGWWCDSDGSCTYAGVGSWHSDGNGWWYQDSTGWYPSNMWQKIDGCWYYFKGDGYMATNQYVDGYWVGANGVCQ